MSNEQRIAGERYLEDLQDRTWNYLTEAQAAIENEREYLRRQERAISEASQGRTFHRPPGRVSSEAAVNYYFRLQEEVQQVRDLLDAEYVLVDQFGPGSGGLWGKAGETAAPTMVAHRAAFGHLEGPPLERWREQRAYEREQEAARERAADRAIGSVADLEA